MYNGTRICLAKEDINSQSAFAFGTVQSAQTYVAQFPSFLLHLEYEFWDDRDE